MVLKLHTNARAAKTFPNRPIKAAAFTIQEILTGNGKEFNGRFCATVECKFPARTPSTPSVSSTAPNADPSSRAIPRSVLDRIKPDKAPQDWRNMRPDFSLFVFIIIRNLMSNKVFRPDEEVFSLDE